MKTLTRRTNGTIVLGVVLSLAVIAAIAALLLVTGGSLAVASILPFGAAPLFFGMAAGDGPGDYVIQPATTATANGTSATTNADALNMRRAQGLAVQLDVTAASGTSPTLDLYIQTSIDGTNWDDVAHFAQVTAVARRYVYISTVVAPTTAERAQQDAALAVATVRQGPMGPWIRAKWVTGGTTPSFTFSIRAHAIGV